MQILLHNSVYALTLLVDALRCGRHFYYPLKKFEDMIGFRFFAISCVFDNHHHISCLKDTTSERINIERKKKKRLKYIQI